MTALYSCSSDSVYDERHSYEVLMMDKANIVML